MNNVVTSILLREWKAYFSTPIAWVFLIIFVFLAALLTFSVGNLFGRGQADLGPFFSLLPWLFLFFLPAVSMRLWAEERQTGNLELLLTLPVRVGQIVLGKFLAAWFFVVLALFLTFPLWVTINYLGEPDNGKVLTGYLAAWLMAGAMLAVGSFLSAATRSQVVAFIVTVLVLFLFMLPGFSGVSPSLLNPSVLADSLVGELVGSMGFLGHYERLAEGIINAADTVFFFGTMAVFLFATGLMLEWKKSHAT